MKKIILAALATLLLMSCNKCASDDANPFFSPFNNEYDLPPFADIRAEHYLPAIIEGIRLDSMAVEAIANNPEPATFENTLAALDTTGAMLDRVTCVLYNLYSADTNDQLDSIVEQVSPMLTEHEDNIMLNDKLFRRIKQVYDASLLPQSNLTAEQKRLTSETYRNFVNNGALLSRRDKERLRQINQELSALDIQFSTNVLAETNAYQKFVTDSADLAGLPQDVIQTASEDAAKAGHPGQWLFTPHRTSFTPVLQYAKNRDLRRELLMAYTTRGNHNNEHDNKAVIVQIMKLRVEKAHLFGYRTPAQYILADCMAKTPDAAYQLLREVWTPSVEQAKKEAAQLTELMHADGIEGDLQPWDWWYYTEKLRKQRFDLKEEDIKPYFELSNVRRGVFQLAHDLYGINITPADYDIKPFIYNPDVEIFTVTDADGSYLGTLYTDYFPRAGKRAGAWMDNLRAQYIDPKTGKDHRPVIINVGNFTKPTSDKPSLLTMDDVETMFHEFGHALHGLLSKCTYKSLSGTNVPRDFVEMPSQIMENWCYEPEVMRTYAKHYKTGEVMPDSLIEKIQRSKTFNQGFVMTELLSASLLDMDFHSLDTTDNFDVEEFERHSLDMMGMIPEIIVRYRSTYFSHIFTTGYEAGYYSYTWSAVLDADAFHAFQETGNVRDKQTAARFRHEILERGNSEDAMTLYHNFRGKEPNVKYLLERKGFEPIAQ
ncbi:MAG TPA: peptidase M3 [Bacteroidales bacterium]|nr:peptidase M3 [Bacteroidales bacterium]